MLGFLQACHQQAKPWRRAGRDAVLTGSGRRVGGRNGICRSSDKGRRPSAHCPIQVAARFAPQQRVERRLRLGEMTFPRVGVLRRQPLEALDPDEGRRAVVDCAVQLREIPMGSCPPGALDGLGRRSGATILEQRAGMVTGRSS